MNILCTICTDLINQTDIINVTKCGHIFHQHCLAQWIERSSSCPQCRQRATVRCVVRAYPTLAREGGPGGEDAATLASRLDHSALQLRELRAELAQRDGLVAKLHAEAEDTRGVVKACEQKLVSAETAAAALREQVRALRAQAREADKLRDQVQQLNSKMNILNGLQRVLSGTSEEVEEMLQQGYSDVRTVATFATALKRALCESEGKKQETRRALEVARREARDQRAQAQHYHQHLLEAEETMTRLRRQCDSVQVNGKRKAEEVEDAQSHEPAKARAPCEPDVSLVSLVRRIESSESPYLQLRQSSAAHALKPSELNLLRGNVARRGRGCVQGETGALSIFPQKRAAAGAGAVGAVPAADVAYDGLGGHARRSPTRAPVPSLPHRTARHRLRAPTTAPKHPATTPSTAFAALFHKRTDDVRPTTVPGAPSHKRTDDVRPTTVPAAPSHKRDAT